VCAAETPDVSDDAIPDINVLTGTLKQYLRELPGKLFGEDMHQRWTDASRTYSTSGMNWSGSSWS